MKKDLPLKKSSTITKIYLFTRAQRGNKREVKYDEGKEGKKKTSAHTGGWADK